MLAARVRSWLRAVFNRSRLESGMKEEMRFHIEQYAEDLVRAGVPVEDARRRARAEFGSLPARQDECREAVGLRLLGELSADARFARSMLRQAPGFAIVAILSIGLGVGANTAIFTLMEAALWKSVPVREPGRLRLLSWSAGPKVEISNTWGSWDSTPEGVTSTVFSHPVYQALERGNTMFSSLFAFKSAGRITALVDGQPELVACHLVSGQFFQGLGVSAIAGSPITEADDRRNAPVVTVISYGWWERRFGRDASIIGRTIRLNQVPVTIIGVSPRDFAGIDQQDRADVFVPLTMQPVVVPNRYARKGVLLDDPDSWWLQVMGRLKPGIGEAQAQASLDVVLRRAARATLPKSPDLPRLRLQSGSRGLDEMSRDFSRPLFVLLALAGVVLLIACANVANLLLARAGARQREIAMRLALGAGRPRIMRQMLTEGLLLAVLGGTAGILFGYLMRDGIPRLISTPWRPARFHARFDFAVLAISIAVTVLTGVLFSLAPVWQATRVELNAAIRQGLRSTGCSNVSLPRLLAGRSLVVFQVALCVVLLVGAGLFVRTLANLKSAELGFRPERLLLFSIDPPRTRYTGERRRALFEQLEEKIAQVPGVQSSTLSWVVLVANSNSTTRALPEGREGPPGPADRTWVNIVGDRFFETMGIPILSGRPIGPGDRPNGRHVAVVNQRFARDFFPQRNALGRTFRTGSDTLLIVGICGDTHYDQIRTDVPRTFYRPFQQVSDLGDMTFEVKTAASEASIIRAVRETVRSVDSDLPVFDVRTQTQQIDDTLSNERLFAALASAFGALALVLAAVGIYGIIAYGAARRTGEIGIRMALGARSRDVLAMILRETVAVAIAGAGIGGLVGLGLTRYLRSMLYGLQPADPLTLGGAILLIFAVSLAAGWLPARKASRLDPMNALRSE